MKVLLSLLASLLFIANCLAIYFLDPLTDRWFRFGTTLIFLFIYIFRYFYNYRLLSIFLLISICDGLIVFYEVPILKKIIYGVRILAYINLILLVLPSLSKLRLNFLTTVISVFIISIDIYLLHEMAESLPATDQNPVFITLFYILGLVSLLLVATAISFLNRFADKKALLLIIVSFGFVLSDIFYYNAYYLEFEEFYYLDRFSNIIGMLALILLARRLSLKLENFKTQTFLSILEE